MILEKTRSRSRIKKPKSSQIERRTNLKRKSTPIPRKSRFKSNANIFKTYHTKRSPEAVAKFAEACRLERIRNPTAAEDAFEQILRGMGLGYEKERIFYYAAGGRFIIADFWLSKSNTIVEADGSAHQAQLKYDIGRDAYFSGSGITVIRFTNQEILNSIETVKAKIIKVMYDR